MAGPPPPPPGFSPVVAAPPRRSPLAGAPRRRDDDEDEGAPPPPPGFGAPAESQITITPNGRVHDGDTFGMQGGGNARMYGYDAFEVGQKGRARDNSVVDLATPSRDMLAGFLPGADIAPTGKQTYGRPVVTVDQDGQDPGANILREGWGLAAPEYLKADPERMRQYMEAERLARLNRLGAHGGKFETPQQFRREDGPWKAAEPGKFGEGEAVFWDEATPNQGLRPEIANAYLLLLDQPNSTKDQILAFAQQNGFGLDPTKVDVFLSKRTKGAERTPGLAYENAPQVLTDLGDGAVGAGARGFADPINMLDEMGGVVDTLGGTKGRENIWNSDRRFGDVLWNNIDQNRSILGFDDANHPYARFGGQFAGGAILPGGAVRGVGLAAGRAALREGATSLAAREAARSAVTNRITLAGGAYGAAAGFGAGEGDIVDRLPGTLIGGAAGTVLGYGTGELGQSVAGAANRLRGRGRVPMVDGNEQPDLDPVAGAPHLGDDLEMPAPHTLPGEGVNGSRGGLEEFRREGNDRFLMYTAPDGRSASIHLNIGDDGTGEISVDPFSLEANRFGPAAIRDAADQLRQLYPELKGVYGTRDTGAGPGRVQRMDMQAEIDPMSIAGPRVRDRIDIPAPPPGFDTIDPIIGRPSQLLDRASAEQMASLANEMQPGDVMPLPGNAVQSMEEAQRIGAGMRPELRAPNEAGELGTRYTPSQVDGTRMLPRKGPIDLVGFLRTQGGLRPQGGELAHLGIDNAPRGIDFAQAENRLGKLVDPENGLNYDEAALRAWEAGYFPDHVDRPTVPEFLDALGATHTGRNRSFLPGDLGEVDAFDAARSQRFAVEAARQEGTPLVDDLGQPIGQDDLQRNAPPISAYEEWGPNGAPDYAGNIDLSKLDTPQDVRRALAVTDVRMAGFDPARRGRISHAETASLAEELGMTADSLLKRRRGQAFNAEQALAARQILAKSGNELVNLARRASGGSDEDLATFRAGWLRHAAIQEQVAGATAEAGRALAQFRTVAKSSAVRERVLPALTNMGGGRNNIEDAARAILDLEQAGATPGQINSFALKAAKPRWKDKALELWYNSLLSGPQTHAVNILSNTLTSALQIPEHIGAAAIGQFTRRSNDRVMASEIAPRIVGMLQGAREGLKAFGNTLKTGNVPDHVTKVEARVEEAIGGVKGKIVRIPTRMLAAEDEFFKSVARRMELSGLAMRKARSEGLRGDALYSRVEELTANPPDEMLDKTLDYARYLTFQRPLGTAGQAVQNLTSAVPALKLFVPFIRTPTNIIKFATERSPFAPILKEVRQDLVAGGARRHLATARIAMGTGLAAVVTQWAKDGAITGSGPIDDNARNLKMADGWQPYSIRVGDQYYSYKRLDPLAMTLGMAADYATKGEHMTEKQRDHAAMVLGASFIENLKDKTWLSGLSDVFAALEDPQRSMERVTKRLAGSIAVPAVISQTARTLDPVQRETDDPIDAIKNRLPGMSQGLRPRLDMWGQPVVNQGGVGPDIVSPVATGTARNDALNSEMMEIGARFGQPSRDGMDDAQYHQFRGLAGTLTAAALRQAMETPEWAMASKEERFELADKIKADQRKAAKEMLFGPKTRKLQRVPLLNGAPAYMGIPAPPPGFDIQVPR